jgi:transposase InsO family protein
VWLYLYLVLDVWSRKIVAWDVQDREDAKLAADLISRGCLRERISKRRQRQLNQHGQQQREVQKLLAVLVKQQLSPGAAPRP